MKRKLGSGSFVSTIKRKGRKDGAIILAIDMRHI
jgi:hypothetical protein